MKSSMHKVITRFPPSPTGFLQLGNVRTAIFNYLFAAKNGGEMILRIEDTDSERSKPEFEKAIYDTLDWLNIPYDKSKVWRQSERGAVYQKYIEKLLENDVAYISKEEEGEGKRGEVIRFRNPKMEVSFKDEVRGHIKFDTTELEDFVIAKSITEPTYHLAVVIDDFEAGVTHIIRGEDHISNTPRQILIQRAIGGNETVYAHLPLILAPDRTKLSKRNGAKPVLSYRDEGYLPDALFNYLSLLGWNPKTEQEIFSREELISSFNLSGINSSGAIFSEEKLRWFNHQYLSKYNHEDFLELIIPIFSKLKNSPSWSEEKLIRLMPEIQGRTEIIGELKKEVDEGSYDYFFNPPQIDPSKILPLKNPPSKEIISEHLKFVISSLENLKDFTKESIKETVYPYATEKGRGDVLWPMRYSLSGKEKSPDPFSLAFILGKEETIERLKQAINMLQ